MTGVFDVLPASIAAGEAAAAGGSAVAAGGTAAAAGGTAATVGTTSAIGSGVAAAETGGAIAAESGGAISAGTATGAGAGLAPAGATASAGGIWGVLGSAYTAAAPYIGAASAGLSAAQRLIAGNTSADALRLQVQQATFNAKQQLLRGQADAQQVEGDLLTTLAQQRARYGASGLDLSFGAPVEVGARSIGAAQRQENIIQDNAGITSAGQKITAAADQAGAAAAQTAGQVGAATSLFDYAGRYASTLKGSKTPASQSIS